MLVDNIYYFKSFTQNSLSVVSSENLIILQQTSSFLHGDSQMELSSHNPVQAGQASSHVTTTSPTPYCIFPNAFSRLHGHGGIYICHTLYQRRKMENRIWDVEVWIKFLEELRMLWDINTGEKDQKKKMSTFVVEV